MSRKGEVLVSLLALLATAGVLSAAIGTGEISPFADIFGLGVLWTIIRKVNNIEVLVAQQPTRDEFGTLRDGIAETVDRGVDRATNVVALAQERMLLEVGEESRRRHQLRTEYEDNRTLVEGRLTAHGEKIAALGAKVAMWPNRTPRTSEG
jgi:hypothetical protein